MTLRESVAASLEVEPPADRDQAVAALALRYADEIDQGEADISKVGPALLAALEALQMSPRARALAQRGRSGSDRSPGQGRLDELRAARARKNGTAPVDSATS